MKILGICGTHKRKNMQSSSEWLLGIALEAARKRNVTTKSIRLIDYKITPCYACNLCRLGKMCPLLEDPDDGCKAIFDMVNEADAVIFSAPTYAYQAPAIMYQLMHRSIPLHEQERAEVWGTKINAYQNNPFHGKPIGNLAVSAALGHEGALFEIFHYLKAMGATPVACAGVALFEPEMKNLFAAADEVDSAMQTLLAMPGVDIQENKSAFQLAQAVADRVVDVFHSELFQSMKDVLKY